MSIPPPQSTTGETRSAASQPQAQNPRLLTRVVASFSALLVLGIAIIFLSAGAWNYWQGWVYLAVMFVPPFFGYLYFLKHDPEVVARRLEQKEAIREQKLLIRWTRYLFIAAFLLPGFDHRWGWSRTLLGEPPLWLDVLGQGLVLAGMSFTFRVLSVNRFAARTIRVEVGQTVVSTGPYAFVRHPMYAGAIVLWIFTPVALGSWVTLPAYALLLPFYVIRLLNEEKVLRAELPGYTEYCQHTRFRLIPYVW